MKIKIDLQLFAENKIGFHPNNKEDEKPIEDALADDALMKEILECSTAINLLIIKKRIATTPLTEIDRRIYSEAIEAKCRSDFGSWSVEEAVRKAKAEEEKKNNPLGFQIENAKVTVATDSVEAMAKFSVITDSIGEEKDICFDTPEPIMDAQDNTKKSGWYKQKVSKVDAINGNIRLYPKSVYEPALDALKKAGFPYAGEHPHPKSYKGANGQVMFDSVVPNQAVKFRNAYIDQQGYVWAEYKPIDTDMGKQVQAMLDAGLPIGFSNRMTGTMANANVNGKNVNVARKLNLYTWDVVLNPAEIEAFDNPVELTDSAITEILDSIENHNEEEKNNMNFYTMSLNELKAWKAQNAGHTDMGICDSMIALKEKAEGADIINDELEKYKKEEAERKAVEEANRKKEEAKTVLTDAVNALGYDNKIKEALISKGSEIITDATQVEGFLNTEKLFIDSLAIPNMLSNLGVPQTGAAQIIDTSIQVTGNAQPWQEVVDKLQTAFDDRIRSKTGEIPDLELRKANKAILDKVMNQMESKNPQEYKKMYNALTDAAKSIENGAITDSAVSTTGDFAQAAIISKAILEQSWQDLNFLQLVMTESFSGSVYEILTEITSTDLYSQDDLITGELEGIQTEGVSTSTLQYGADWIKRGTVITKEAMQELLTGPFNYDVLARNLANLPMRFNRYIDQRLSLEMVHTSDEYKGKRKDDEAVAATEIVAVTPGLHAPSGTNAAFVVQLLCAYNAGAVGKMIPSIVRPRNRVSITAFGKKQVTVVNDIVAKVGSTTLKRGVWNTAEGKILNGDYAVDFENAKVYFTAASGVNATNRPTVSYSYATNISFFDMSIPDGVDSSKYYNKLIEKLEFEKAFMGSAPRYVTPNFAIGSLNAMAPIKIAELFYKSASPEGTNLLKGRPYFATRSGMQLGEINAPWAIGDSRMLLGKINATRFGVGSTMQIEGPEPYYTQEGKITSAKQYYATQQISVATPLITDEQGNAYNPPYRTIKFFNSK